MQRVLILASGQWLSTARLALELRAAGCEVQVACPANHPLLHVREPFVRHAYSAFRPLASLRNAIAAASPDLLIAADELILLHLEELWHSAAAGSPLRALLSRSVGGERVLAAGRSRLALLEAARQQKIATPKTLSVDSDAAMMAAIEACGFPLVLKADATSGGRGVRVVHSAAEARRAWRILHGPTSLVRAAKRAVIGHEFTHLRPWAQRELRGVTAQEFVSGAEHTVMAVCREGRVVSSVSFAVLRIWCERGPSSVVRVEHDAATDAAVAAVAATLGVSGFCGFDFIDNPADGRRLLIEMNPRPTQLVHVPLGAGADLVAAYTREIAGIAVTDRPSRAPQDVIALFPLEMQRDPASEFLSRAYHDVPWTEPALVRHALGTVPPELLKDPRWCGNDKLHAVADAFPRPADRATAR